MSRGDVVAAARLWLGTPYRHQAATLGAGCDCLGLLRGVWRTLYGEEPLTLPNYRADLRDARHADELWTAAERLLGATYSKPEAGQVVLFRLRTTLPKHCGILVAPDRFIHAQEGLGVIEANLTDGWRKRVFGLFEFPETTRL
ncbi:MAG: C40 family peptidase [Devosia nanyangense]|uniref:C40 family peptidase n=1 Tax=Devosia nanyangense TaxID=1228055 RepID=A0A933L2Q1_9HYPH|nr:C40 family peptidase [Devosia nanyangense]